MSIELRNGVYYSRIMINGKRVHRSLGRNKRIAEELHGEMIKQRNAGKFGYVQSGAPWPSFRRRYEAWAEGTKNPTTQAHNKRAFQFIEAFRHPERLEDVTPEVLEDLRVSLVKDHKKPGINRAITSLIAMMRRAEEWKLVRPQNWRIVGRFKVAVGRLLYYSFEQFDKMLEFSSDYWKAFEYLGGRAGLRIGEIFNAKKTDVDFDLNRIFVRPNPDTGWTPKDYECRWIPLHPRLREFLLWWFSVQTKSEYIVADLNGWRPASAAAMAVEFKKQILKKLHLDGSAHTLRHTFAAHAVMRGVSLRKLKEWMGHASIKTTMIYAHLSPDEQGTGMDLIP